jgi:hypothetical protein
VPQSRLPQLPNCGPTCFCTGLKHFLASLISCVQEWSAKPHAGGQNSKDNFCAKLRANMFLHMPDTFSVKFGWAAFPLPCGMGGLKIAFPGKGREQPHRRRALSIYIVLPVFVLNAKSFFQLIKIIFFTYLFFWSSKLLSVLFVPPRIEKIFFTYLSFFRFFRNATKQKKTNK